MNKKASGKKEVDTNKIVDAAGYAINEASLWDSASDKILEQGRVYKSQFCVNALFSIELYLKAILFCFGKNVTKMNLNHNIRSCYELLNDDYKEKIKDGIKIDREILIEFPSKRIITFNTFEEELEFISNDFVDLRYEYEKFLNGMGIIILTDFIMQLKNNCRKLALNLFTTKKRVKLMNSNNKKKISEVSYREKRNY